MCSSFPPGSLDTSPRMKIFLQKSSCDTQVIPWMWFSFFSRCDGPKEEPNMRCHLNQVPCYHCLLHGHGDGISRLFVVEVVDATFGVVFFLTESHSSEEGHRCFAHEHIGSKLQHRFKCIPQARRRSCYEVFQRPILASKQQKDVVGQNTIVQKWKLGVIVSISFHVFRMGKNVEISTVMQVPIPLIVTTVKLVTLWRRFCLCWVGALTPRGWRYYVYFPRSQW